jgi:hypothetical protein
MRTAVYGLLLFASTLMMTSMARLHTYIVGVQISSFEGAQHSPAKFRQCLIKLDYCRYFRHQQMRVVISPKVQHMFAVIAGRVFPKGRGWNYFS